MRIFQVSVFRRSNVVSILVGLLLLNLFLTMPLPVQATPQLDSAERLADSTFSTLSPIVLPLPDNRRIKISGQGKPVYCNETSSDICTPGTKEVEIFDPTNNTWTIAPSLQTKRFKAMGVVLNDGKILVTGGIVEIKQIPNGQYDYITHYQDTATSEIYDPAANTWQAAAPMQVSRHSAGLTLLKDGRVLVVGGTSYSQTPQLAGYAEVYNPVTNQWNTLTTKPLLTGNLTVYTLDNGKVAGLNGAGEVAVYDPTLDLWSRKSSAVRSSNSTGSFSYVKLSNGEIVALELKNATGNTTNQIYNPGADTWTAFPQISPASNVVYDDVIYMEDYSTLAIQKRVYPYDYKQFYFYNLATNTSSESANLYQSHLGLTLNYLDNGKILSHGGFTQQLIAPRILPIYTFYKDTSIYQLDMPANPQAPGKFEVSKNATSVTFKWQDRATNEDGYIIERKPATQPNWQEIGRTAANATTFTDTTPLADTRMDYRVKAFKGSSYSLAVSVSNLQVGALPVYRFYRLSNGTHFYTMDEKEKNTLVEQYSNEMKYEGVAYKGWDGYESNPNLVMVYRFYNTQTKAHFYTSNSAEKDALIANWSQLYTFEGMAFYAQAGAGAGENIKGVYRFYNYQTKAHFYTANPAEKDALVANWKQLYNYEGVAFYASW